MKKSTFLLLMGDTPILRVLEFLVVNDEFDQSMTEIARSSGVGYATLKLFWPMLERHGIVRQVRKVGKAKMYRLNDKNPAVEKFKGFYWETVKRDMRQQAKVTIAAKHR